MFELVEGDGGMWMTWRPQEDMSGFQDHGHTTIRTPLVSDFLGVLSSCGYEPRGKIQRSRAWLAIPCRAR